MKLSKLTDSWKVTHQKNQLLLLSNIGLVIALLASVGVSLFRTTVVTVVPPGLSQSASIEQNASSSSYYEAWALSISELLGHAASLNISFVKKALSHYFDPLLYASVITQMEGEVETMESEGYRISFVPLNASYEPATKKTFISGNLTTTFRDGGSSSTVRTYEFVFKTVNYNPVVISFNVYGGYAKTLQEIARLKNQQKVH